MKVYLLKNVENLGHAGKIINVSDGHARNFLIPRALAVEITSKNESSFKQHIKEVEHQKEVNSVKTSQLAQRLEALDLVLKRKIHDGGKLYGAISAAEIVDIIAQNGININKSQVDLDKSIKTKGVHNITIKLSSQLKPVVKLKIVPEDNI